jgi:hypothetical protein
MKFEKKKKFKKIPKIFLNPNIIISFIFFTDLIKMSRFLVNNPNPRVIEQHADLEEIDVDHMAFNIPVDHEGTLDVLKSFVGSSLQLSTNKGRLWRQENWQFLILSWNPIITLVAFSNDTKQCMCEYFSANGHIVLRRVSSPRTKLLAARCE